MVLARIVREGAFLEIENIDKTSFHIVAYADFVELKMLVRSRRYVT